MADLDKLTQANRVSIRAVIVPAGQDASKALLDAGIVEPVAIPFLYDGGDIDQGMMTDGRTPNVTATLEMDRHAQPEPTPEGQQPTSGRSWTASAPTPTTTLPAAYGLTPLAPIRKRPSS
jgi:hypothetical protein